MRVIHFATVRLLKEYEVIITSTIGSGFWAVLTKKTYNSTGTVIETVIYGTENFVRVVNTSGTYDFTYVKHEGQLVGQKNPDGSKLFIHTDHEGSTSLVTSEAQVVVENTSYSPFGEIVTGGTNRFDYEGKEFDTVVGDYDFHFRKYNPQWGLFTQPDSLIQNVYDPQSLNRYSFERNNPYKYEDRSGHARTKLAKNTAVKEAGLGAASSFANLIEINLGYWQLRAQVDDTKLKNQLKSHQSEANHVLLKDLVSSIFSGIPLSSDSEPSGSVFPGLDLDDYVSSCPKGYSCMGKESLNLLNVKQQLEYDRKTVDNYQISQTFKDNLKYSLINGNTGNTIGSDLTEQQVGRIMSGGSTKTKSGVIYTTIDNGAAGKTLVKITPKTTPTRYVPPGSR